MLTVIVHPSIEPGSVVFYCCVVGRFAWAEATSRSEEFKRYVAGDFTQGTLRAFCCSL